MLAGDLVIRDPDGKRHVLGRIQGRDGRAPRADEIDGATAAWMREHREELRGKTGEPGKNATPPSPLQVADAMFDDVRDRVFGKLRADLREPITADLEDRLLPALEGRLEKPIASSLASRIRSQVAEQLLPQVSAGIAEQLEQAARQAAAAAALAAIAADPEAFRGKPGKPGISPQPEPAITGDPGPIGPMPKHRWSGTALQFETAPGIWGPLRDLEGRRGDDLKGAANFGGAKVQPGPPGTGITAAAFRAGDGHLLLTLSDGSTIDAGAVPVPFDDYTSVEYLADQVSAGSVLTFSFTGGAVQKVWVEMQAADVDDVDTGRVRVDGGTPTATVGTLLHAGQVQPISSPPTSTVKVLAPAGKVVSVYGYRR